jgi:TatD DNase family protein
MIDTHCHLTCEQLAGQVDDIIARAASSGVERMITIATNPDDSRQAVALTHRYENLYATAGLQPHDAAAWPDREEVASTLCDLADQPKVVALGEMGLDYYYNDPVPDIQRRAFAWQLQLMQQLDLPAVIHNRQATDDVIAMIKDADLPGERFVFHCFTGSSAELDTILDFGPMISFTGIVTFSSAADLAKASDRVPIARLMVETDSPYLTPHPHRKVRPNEPRYVVDVASFLATRRNMNLEDFTKQTDANAERFFPKITKA